MSPASYLTAPPRVAAAIVAPSGPAFPSTMRVVTLAIWLSLAFLLAASLGSLGWAAARAWRAWKAFRGTSGRLTDALGAVAASAESAERHAVALADGNERLSAAVARLQSALAELAVLRRAAGETQSLLAAVRGVVPTK